jgi:AAA15 family ATPase/GTPase
LWDSINLTDLQDEVIEGLRLINRDIKGVVLVGGEQSSSKSRIPIVRIEQSPERFPLKSMGDGMTRLFHLILALANAKDGTLLVDEFENGLHWSVLPKVWDTVFTLAERLNVQVFATTHSRDCIQGFKQAWEQNESLGSFHRLDPDPEDGVKSVAYSLETLSDALDMDVEVR